MDVKDGKIGVDHALRILRSLPYEDMGFAKIDTHRDLRKGFPEVIFCKGKTVKQIRKIVEKLSSEERFIMATKASRTDYEVIKEIRDDQSIMNSLE